jgi:hypothetical protein
MERHDAGPFGPRNDYETNPATLARQCCIAGVPAQKLGRGGRYSPCRAAGHSDSERFKLPVTGFAITFCLTHMCGIARRASISHTQRAPETHAGRQSRFRHGMEFIELISVFEPHMAKSTVEYRSRASRCTSYDIKRHWCVSCILCFSRQKEDCLSKVINTGGSHEFCKYLVRDGLV